MRHTTGHTLRALIVAGLFSLGCLVSRASAQSPSAGEDSAFFRAFPMAWVYRGVALYTAKDYEGAISAWQNYIARAGSAADSEGVDALIRDAWVRAYPMALVYDGYARYVNNDIAGAINSLERYIELAPAGADTASIRQVIANVLIPELELAKLSSKISWFVNHEPRDMLDDLTTPAVGSLASERRRGPEMRSITRKQAFKVYSR